jgi:predicted nucleic acid-binding protein
MLIALGDEDHVHRAVAMKWFRAPGLDWGICAFSEAGFLRVAANPNGGKLSVRDATQILGAFQKLPGYRFWTITGGWASLAAPFTDRVFGHQQITDALLLGLAIKENGVLVTLDKGIRYMAGPKFSKNLLVLEA